MMRFFEILPKAFSLLIAGVDVYAMYCFYQWDKAGWWGTPLYGEEGEAVISVLMAIGWIGFSLGFVWFAEYISDWLEQTGGWNPTWLIKFVGWVFLLFPAIVILYYKVL